ncbi:hypothetical protein F53441_12935 [Fusarium austroafricanum]|uniref:WSC domain-containing protein n=1 Tax=Fusarium austroafricanum TaxID=2364996 RepID=A0A8H4JUI3_9HYPO|nr:hypothetical protein F53441_12935 [Fusarium austroafricanum]
MRLSSVVLLAVATTVAGQTFTGFINNTVPTFETGAATGSYTSSSISTENENVSSTAARSDSSSDADTTTTTMTSWSTTTTTEFPTPSTSDAGFPNSTDGFTFFGCLSSTTGFPTFELAGSSGTMDLGICALGCVGRAFFGVYGSDCYCGDEVVHDDNSLVSSDECDLHCPGNFWEFCGGQNRQGSLRARQAIPSNRLLTVYTSAIFGPGIIQSVTESATDSITKTATDSSIESATESNTASVAGRTTTFFTTLTTTLNGLETTTTDVITTALTCHNGKCYSQSDNRIVYIFVERNGSDYDDQWVYVAEPCSCPGGQQYVPKFCSSGSCSKQVVYLAQKCRDWHNHRLFYVPMDCDTCQHGEVMFKPWENSWGTPDNYKTNMIPACSGSKCPPTQYSHVPGSHGIGFNSTFNVTTHQAGSGSGSHGGSSQGGSSHSNGSGGIDTTGDSSERHSGSSDNAINVPIAVSSAQKIAASVGAFLPVLVASLL